MYSYPSGATVRCSNLYGEQPVGHDMREGELAVNTNDGRVYVMHQGIVVCLTQRTESTNPYASRVQQLEAMILTLQAQLDALRSRIERDLPEKWLDSAVEEFETTK